MKTNPPIPIMSGQEAYKNMVDLMAVLAEATSRLTAMQSEVQAQYLEIVDGHRSDYSELQSKVSKAEAAIEIIARDHPEWFGKSKSVKTLYGKVEFRSGTKLDVPNEEASIILIEKSDDAEAAKLYLRQKTELNLEGLEKLTDAQLAAYRINRVKTENFAVKPGTIDLGKAVQEAEKEKKAA